MHETLEVAVSQIPEFGIGGKKEKIELVKVPNRFTLLFQNRDETTKEQILRIIEGIESAKIFHVRSNIFEVLLGKDFTLKDIEILMEKIRTNFPDVIVHHVYKKNKGGNAKFYLTDEIIVTYAPTFSEKNIQKIEGKFSLKRVKSYVGATFLPKNTYLLRVTKNSVANPVKIASRLWDEEGVLDANPNLLKVNMRIPEPKDRDIDEPEEESAIMDQWYLNASDEPSRPLRSDAGIDAKGAWDLLKGINPEIKAGDKNIVVAIIDTSFRVTHFALEHSLMPGFKRFDFTTGEEDAFENPKDHHGTRCAGVIFAKDADKDIFGIAHSCTFLPVKILDNHTERDLIEVAEAVGLVADVISCSWAPSPDDSLGLNPILAEIFSKIARTGGRRKSGKRKKGTVICLSAGNENLPIFHENLEGVPYCRRGIKQNPYFGLIRNPYAVHPDVIVVAASTSNTEKAPYSCFGKEISVCAPSDNYGACVKRKVTFRVGPGIWTTDLAKDYTDRFGGTSCSTPLVAGVAALILSANPGLTAKRVRAILERSADQINKPAMDQSNSEGKYVTMQKPGRTRRKHSIWFGYGKVNAKEAVRLAIESLPG